MAPTISIKIPEPKSFQGNLKEAKVWINQLERYFLAVGYDVGSVTADALVMCNIACALCSGDAARWLDRLTQQKEYPASWIQFKDRFKKQWIVLDDENTARDKLKEARQRGKVQDFITYFDTLVMSLPKASTEELIHNFIYGLKQPVRGLLKAQISSVSNPTLSEVMTLALRLEDNVGQGRRDTPYQVQPRYYKPSVNPTPPAPPPKEAVTYDRDGDVVMGNLKAKIRCYNCNKLGHFARDCRQPKRPRQPAKVNAIERTGEPAKETPKNQ